MASAAACASAAAALAAAVPAAGPRASSAPIERPGAGASLPASPSGVASVSVGSGPKVVSSPLSAPPGGPVSSLGPGLPPSSPFCPPSALPALPPSGPSASPKPPTWAPVPAGALSRPDSVRSLEVRSAKPREASSDMVSRRLRLSRPSVELSIPAPKAPRAPTGPVARPNALSADCPMAESDWSGLGVLSEGWSPCAPEGPSPLPPPAAPVPP